MSVLAEYMTKTIRFDDDSLKDEEVLIKKLSTDEQKELGQMKDDLERGLATILRSVVRWSFKNENGQPIAISRENIGKIRGDIINTIAAGVTIYNLPVKSKENKDGRK